MTVRVSPDLTWNKNRGRGGFRLDEKSLKISLQADGDNSLVNLKSSPATPT